MTKGACRQALANHEVPDLETAGYCKKGGWLEGGCNQQHCQHWEGIGKDLALKNSSSPFYHAQLGTDETLYSEELKWIQPE